MRLRFLFALAYFVAAGSACNDTPDTLVEGGYDKAEMDAAIARPKRSRLLRRGTRERRR